MPQLLINRDGSIKTENLEKLYRPYIEMVKYHSGSWSSCTDTTPDPSRPHIEKIFYGLVHRGFPYDIYVEQ